MMKLILIIRSLLSLICVNTLFLFSKSAMIFVVIAVLCFGHIKYCLIKIVFPEMYCPIYYFTFVIMEATKLLDWL